MYLYPNQRVDTFGIVYHLLCFVVYKYVVLVSRYKYRGYIPYIESHSACDQWLGAMGIDMIMFSLSTPNLFKLIDG